ncbi:MAG: DNA alkylation repair protein [Bacteroidaceae bacterium]|nr:DNA alkylation repair protein [Bacteroidaceae bacterium]
MSNAPTTRGDGVIDAIRADLRAAMNGVAAAAIRRSGMAYRLAYGVELPRLRDIAAAYTPDRRLAQTLWDEDVREMRMLAIMLFPHQDMDRQRALTWIDGIRPAQAELAGLFAMEQLAPQPWAADMAFCLIADTDAVRQLCGYLTIGRLLMGGAQLAPHAESELRDQAEAALADDFAPLRRAAANTLSRL